MHWPLLLSSCTVFETFSLLYKGLVIIAGHGELVCEIHNIIDPCRLHSCIVFACSNRGLV